MGVGQSRNLHGPQCAITLTIQPTTSFATPAASVVRPTGFCSSLSSVRILARTGKAVMLDVAE